MLENNNNKGKNYPLFTLFTFFFKKKLSTCLSALTCVFICAEGFNIHVQPPCGRQTTQDDVSGDRLSVLLQSPRWGPL